MTTLDGQVAIVTGGARGQGRAHAAALASLGARVVVCDVPAPMTAVRYPLGTAEDLALTVSLVKDAGSEAIAVAADVRDPAAVAKVADAAIAEFGRIDILVANAGIVSTGRLGRSCTWPPSQATSPARSSRSALASPRACTRSPGPGNRR